MKNKKNFRPRKKATQWTNPATGRLEVKPLIEMSEEEIQAEGGLRQPVLNINREEFVKTKKQKKKLKHLKSLHKKRSAEIKLDDQREILDVLKHSRIPRWGSCSIKVA